MTESYVIREATEEDLARLVPLAQRTFLAAFGDSNDPGDMAAYVTEAFSEEQMRVELDEEWSVFFLADVQGELLGYAKLRKGTDGTEGIGPQPVELQRIYVDAQAIGTGMGAKLMEAATARAIADGYKTMWLGVWEENRRAIAFYERWGFETIGEHVFRLGSDDQVDLVMQRML